MKKILFLALWGSILLNTLSANIGQGTQIWQSWHNNILTEVCNDLREASKVATDENEILDLIIARLTFLQIKAENRIDIIDAISRAGESMVLYGALGGWGTLSLYSGIRDLYKAYNEKKLASNKMATAGYVACTTFGVIAIGLMVNAAYQYHQIRGL